MQPIPSQSEKRMQLAIVLEKKVNAAAGGLGLEALVMPYDGDGIRVVILRGVKRGVRTIGVRTFGPIKGSIKEFANGVLGAMWPKLKAEIEQLRRMQGILAK